LKNELLLQRGEPICASGTRERGKVYVTAKSRRKPARSWFIASVKASRSGMRGCQKVVFGIQVALGYNEVRRKPAMLMVR
jgi:hypothetical protein